MPITGDFAKLGHWADLMRRSAIIAEAATEAMAQRAVDLVGDGFNRGRNPYGERWKPKQKPNGYPIMHGPSGLLEYGWHVLKTKRRGFVIANDAPYAAAHQKPTRGKRPMRMMVPSTSRGLPPSWVRAFSSLSTNVFQAYFTGEASNENALAAVALQRTGNDGE